MSTIWIGTILSALLLTVSILVLGGYTIRSRMERPIAWGRLVLLDLPFVLGITVLLLWAGMDAAYILRVSILSSFLPLVAVIDHREMIIPNRILLWMLTYWGLAMALQIWQMGYPNPNVLLDFILGGLIGASPLLVRLVSKGGIGMGDIKLFAIVGLYVGKQDILRADDIAGKDAAFFGMEFDGVFQDKITEVGGRERECGNPSVLAGHVQAGTFGDGFSQDIVAVFIRVNMKKLTGQAVDYDILFLQQFDRVIQLYIHDVLLGFLRVDHGYIKSGITNVRPGFRRGDRVHDPGEPEDLRALRLPARYQALQEFKPFL